MQSLLLTIYHGSKILQFLTEDSCNLLLPICKFRNATYEKVHLDLLQSIFKIKLKVLSQLSKKFVDKFCSP